MSTGPMNTVATIVPGLRYVDAPAAIEWLEKAFGFEASMVAEGSNGTIAHAQLKFGNGMIMLGTAGKHETYDELVKMPKDLGAQSQAPYVIVEDADAHYDKAKARAPRLSWTSIAPITADAPMRPMIRRGICGTSEPMIPGRKSSADFCYFPIGEI